MTRRGMNSDFASPRAAERRVAGTCEHRTFTTRWRCVPMISSRLLAARPRGLEAADPGAPA